MPLVYQIRINMQSNFLNKRWQDRGFIERAGIIGGSVALILFGRKAYKNLIVKIRENKYKNLVQSEQSELENKGQQLTFPKSNYFTFADQLDQAFQYAGTDEQSIYNIFSKMKNDLDILELNNAFGKRSIYFFGIGDDLTLPKAIREELDQDEISVINKMLYAKKIKYRY